MPAGDTKTPELIKDLRHYAESLGERTGEMIDHHVAIPADREAIDAAQCMAEAADLLEKLVAMTAAQAEDSGLWFIAKFCPEAYLQQELRKLHALIETGDPGMVRHGRATVSKP